jgi:hypothetical protein
MRPVVSVSALTWFIRYIYIYILLKFTVSKYLIIIITKVLLPQAWVTLRAFGLLSLKHLNCLVFQYFDIQCI